MRVDWQRLQSLGDITLGYDGGKKRCTGAFTNWIINQLSVSDKDHLPEGPGQPIKLPLVNAEHGARIIGDNCAIHVAAFEEISVFTQITDHASVKVGRWCTHDGGQWLDDRS